MKAFCVEINTKLFHSPLLTATLSLLFNSLPPLIPFFLRRVCGVVRDTNSTPFFYIKLLIPTTPIYQNIALYTLLYVISSYKGQVVMGRRKKTGN